MVKFYFVKGCFFMKTRINPLQLSYNPLKIKITRYVFEYLTSSNSLGSTNVKYYAI